MKKVLPSLDMNSAKLVVQVKVVKNALWVYVEAISHDRKDARLLSMPRLSQTDILLVMCFICKFLS